MLRVTLAVASMLSLCVGSVLIAGSQDTKKSGAQTNQGNTGAQIKTDAQTEKNKATITKVDTQNHTIAVKMKDKEGKDKERVFKLTEDIRYFDSTGKAVAVDVFRSGHLVLIVEREGQLKELHQEKDQPKNQTK